MSVQHISSESDLNGYLSKDSLTVIDFHATWCGPCKMIAPVYEKLAQEYPNVNFLKCDVDAVPSVAQNYKVTAMPTFVFLKGTEELERIQGANQANLKSAVARHSVGSKKASGTVAFTGKGQTLGGPSIPEVGTDGLINLSPQMKVLAGFVGVYLLLWYLS